MKHINPRPPLIGRVAVYFQRALMLVLGLGILVVLTGPWRLEASPTPLAAESNNYVFHNTWGAAGDKLYSPKGMAIGPDESIYIANSGFHRITRFVPEDRTFNNFGGYGDGLNQLLSPAAVSIYSSTTNAEVIVYVAEPAYPMGEFDTLPGKALIKKFDTQGNEIGMWYLPVAPDLSWTIDQVTGMAVDGNGYVYVAYVGDHCIVKFNSYGGTVRRIGYYGASNGLFYQPHGIATDNVGNIYVADTGNNRIQKLDSGGNYLEQSPAGLLNKPQGVAVGPNGYVYVADTGNNMVRVLDSNLDPLTPALEWGRGAPDPKMVFNAPVGIGVTGSGSVYVTEAGEHRVVLLYAYGSQWYMAEWSRGWNGQFTQPRGVSVDRDDQVYVSDRSFNLVQKFTAAGSYLSYWGGSGSENSQFNLPNAIAFGITDTLFVAEVLGNRIQEFTLDGLFLQTWGHYGSGMGEFNQPYGLAVDRRGKVYVSESGSRIQEFVFNETTGVYSATQMVATAGSGDGQVSTPAYLAVGITDTLYVADHGNHRVQKFGLTPITPTAPISNYTFLSQWGSYGTAYGQFFNLEGIAVDATGHVYVSDRKNNRIQKFTDNGVFETQWGINISDTGGFTATPGSLAGQFYLPFGIAVNSAGRVYVADTSNHRIQEFTNGYPEPDPVSGLVLNGSFESTPALAEWTYGGELTVTQSSEMTRSAPSLKLSESIPFYPLGLEQGTAWAYQPFYVPTTTVHPMLSFAYDMHVNDVKGYSDFFVDIQDGLGLNHLATVVWDGFVPCDGKTAPTPGHDLGWRTVAFDLSAYKGKDIRVTFYNRNMWPGAYGIWTYVDDVRVWDTGLSLPPRLYLPAVMTQRCDYVKPDKAILTEPELQIRQR